MAGFSWFQVVSGWFQMVSGGFRSFLVIVSTEPQLKYKNIAFPLWRISSKEEMKWCCPNGMFSVGRNKTMTWYRNKKTKQNVPKIRRGYQYSSIHSTKEFSVNQIKRYIKNKIIIQYSVQLKKKYMKPATPKHTSIGDALMIS